MGKKKVQVGFLLLAMAFLTPQVVYGMHIMEGFLPIGWSIFWTIVSLPFVVAGFLFMKKKIEQEPKLKMLLALAGAFVFVLSSLKLPSVTGSCSHPTGIGLGAILFGAPIMSVLGGIVLVFQAVLLAHGGLTTLGANTFSMGIAGAFVSVGVYQLVRKLGGKQGLAVFLAAALGNMATYIVTSIQLGVAFPAETGGVMESVIKFLGVFAVTQIPLAVSEGILTVVVFNLLMTYSKQELTTLSLIAKEV